ncbi:selenocysteine-specific translation elongation factor [Sulfobacillus harzensis]|uniref:Selenocysteine-specific elongation factor n=1 Tax=Sulfobacillus harzensis TaxID=2729629 RepID=A0A7Y0Q324_9FIRM|nr:selenocysteine-specific translation elongation factor [Sulfobacillus harzensis]NMP22516.1 selenocysteine-specific translation elongation factor [Sulfobacillus harzensis]
MANPTRYPVIVGTAGHIDHGKTTLVKALTGQDADRLPEEKARGITIDLGFAHMTLPSGQRLAFIDVPGHERFVRNMVAGVHGMDAVMLVVAADEGVMPQTEEHLAILRLLGVKRGFTVITKADLVEADMLDLVQEMVREAVQHTFLQSAPIVVADAVSGRGLDTVVKELEALSVTVERRADRGAVRLPIDRVFSVKGFGTVVTGTLVTGTIGTDAALSVVPLGKSVRVRGLQVHGRTVNEAKSGQRVAVNLAGVEREEIERGQVVASPGTLIGVDVAVVDLELLPSAPPLTEKTRVHVHAGTAEVLGRVYFYDRGELAPGESAFAEVRLESVMPLTRHDRLLIRSYSPVVTIGGGMVLEAGTHHKRKEPHLIERLTRLRDQDDIGIIEAALKEAAAPLALQDLERLSGLTRDEILSGLHDLPGILALEGEMFWHREAHSVWAEKGRAVVERYSQDHPVKPGMPKEELKAKMAAKWPQRVFQAVIEQGPWTLDREWIRLQKEPPPLPSPWPETIERVYQLIRDGGLRPQGYEEVQSAARLERSAFDDIVEYLFLAGKLLRLEDGLAIAADAYREGRDRVMAAIQEQGPLSTSQLRDVLGISRRHAVLFLELLDRERVTRRVGDMRELVSNAAS